MQIEITLNNIKPFSINSYYVGRNRVRSTEARKWGMSIHSRLKEYESVFLNFRNAFDPKLHALECEITYNIPNLYNGKGTINHQAKDLTNVEKTIIDIVTGNKYFERGETTLNIDDRYIVTLLSKKRLAEKYSIHIKFTRINIHID